MGFRDAEKARYEVVKSELFSREACVPGTYNGVPRPFCLADERSIENLHESIRDEAVAYFRARGIPWHDGLPDAQGKKAALPSNHLCCSQSFCVNSLWPLTSNSDLLASVFRPFIPDLAEPLPLYADGLLPSGAKTYLAFEWIGSPGTNYLCERGRRSRGANATSADFAFRFRRYDDRIQLVLGEWKYTECYGKAPPTLESVNRVQLGVYREAFGRWLEVQPDLPEYHTFFVEPFYQLMRLTLLAREMERARLECSGEMEADIVSVLHVAPKANRDFTENLAAAPELQRLGRTVGAAWTHIALTDRFLSVPTEGLITIIEQVAPEPLYPWRDYLLRRYAWWRATRDTRNSQRVRDPDRTHRHPELVPDVQQS